MNNSNYIATKDFPPVPEDAAMGTPATQPIIPEVSPDGTKRLYKTRYNMLEKMYREKEAMYSIAKKANDSFQKQNRDLSMKNRQLHMEMDLLKAQTVDAQKVDNLIRLLAKEAQIEFPVHEFASTLDERIRSFFGALKCKLIAAEQEDELDVVLMKSDPFDVIGAITLSRATLRKMHQNLWWAAGYNTIAFPTAAGLFYPAFGLYCALRLRHYPCLAHHCW